MIKLQNSLKPKKERFRIKKITIVNNEILIFLKNSFILKFDLYGNLEDLKNYHLKLSQTLYLSIGQLFI